MKTCMTLSTLSTTSIEDIAAASQDGLRWFQLYVVKNRDITRQFVKRAEKSGFKALVVTVDAPVLGNRRIDVKNRSVVIYNYSRHSENYFVPFSNLVYRMLYLK